jgi:hypothetical protein
MSRSAAAPLLDIAAQLQAGDTRDDIQHAPHRIALPDAHVEGARDGGERLKHQDMAHFSLRLTDSHLAHHDATLDGAAVTGLEATEEPRPGELEPKLILLYPLPSTGCVDGSTVRCRGWLVSMRGLPRRP